MSAWSKDWHLPPSYLLLAVSTIEQSGPREAIVASSAIWGGLHDIPGKSEADQERDVRSENMLGAVMYRKLPPPRDASPLSEGRENAEDKAEATILWENLKTHFRRVIYPAEGPCSIAAPTILSVLIEASDPDVHVQDTLYDHYFSCNDVKFVPGSNPTG